MLSGSDVEEEEKKSEKIRRRLGVAIPHIPIWLIVAHYEALLFCSSAFLLSCC